jgi:hypothetical protein
LRKKGLFCNQELFASGRFLKAAFWIIFLESAIFLKKVTMRIHPSSDGVSIVTFFKLDDHQGLDDVYRRDTKKMVLRLT